MIVVSPFGTKAVTYRKTGGQLWWDAKALAPLGRVMIASLGFRVRVIANVVKVEFRVLGQLAGQPSLGHWTAFK